MMHGLELFPSFVANLETRFKPLVIALPRPQIKYGCIVSNPSVKAETVETFQQTG